MTISPGRPGQPRPAYLANVSWLLGDHALRVGVGFLVNIWVVRHLGPEQFGALGYALGVLVLVTPLTVLGLDGIVVRELARSRQDPGALLGSAFLLKLAGSGIAVLLVLLDQGRLLMEEAAPLTSIVALSCLFNCLNVIDLYFQSIVAARYVVIARQVQTWLGVLLRIVLLALGADVVWFAWVVVGEALLVGLGMIIAYRLRGGPRRWRFDRGVAALLLREGWPFLGVGLALSIEMRIGLILLGDVAGPAEVAQYALALGLVGMAGFIPEAMSKTFAAALTQEKEKGPESFFAYLTELNRLMLWLGIAIALPLMLSAPFLVPFLYGPAFTEAGSLLGLLALRIPLIMVGPIRRLFVINAGLSRYALLSAIVATSASILFNLWLVTSYRAEGAVLAQLLSLFIGLVLIDLFHPPARLHLRAMARAAMTPLALRDTRRLLRAGSAEVNDGRPLD